MFTDEFYEKELYTNWERKAAVVTRVRSFSTPCVKYGVCVLDFSLILYKIFDLVVISFTLSGQGGA